MSSIESTKEQEEWNTIQTQMDDLLNNSTKNSTTCTTTSIQQATSTLNNMSALSQQLTNKSTSIKSKLSSQISSEQSAITSENTHLSTLLSTTQNLQNQLSKLQQTNNTINKQRKELEEVNIPKWKDMASEVVNELEEVEVRHLRKLPKLKNEFSLHALLTNIKWDFNNTNQLAGEVSIPNKAIHQRFCLDKNELSEFDISNKLWKMIEG